MIVKQRSRAGSVDQMDFVGDVRDRRLHSSRGRYGRYRNLCKADVLAAMVDVFFACVAGLKDRVMNVFANSKMEEVSILNTIPTTPQRSQREVDRAGVWHHCWRRRSSTFMRKEYLGALKQSGGLAQ
jgi:ribose-phosphate pyrophosphokinase